MKFASRGWRLPLITATCGLLLFFGLVLASPDFGLIGFDLLVVPATSLVLIILMVRRRGAQLLWGACLLLVFWGGSSLLSRSEFEVRTSERWLLESGKYKAEVKAQPLTTDGTLRHVEWDGWGFAGAGDTTAYLVLDPVDRLASYTKPKLKGNAPGLPCEVYKVRRMEDHWYVVLFYTETDWTYCAPY